MNNLNIFLLQAVLVFMNPVPKNFNPAQLYKARERSFVCLGSVEQDFQQVVFVVS